MDNKASQLLTFPRQSLHTKGGKYAGEKKAYVISKLADKKLNTSNSNATGNGQLLFLSQYKFSHHFIGRQFATRWMYNT